MVKLNKKVIISIALIAILTIILATNVLAFDPNEYDPHPIIQTRGTFMQRAEIVLGWIRFFGMIIAILALAFMGLKYMFTSVEGKAEYKKAILPYVVGCFMLMGVSLLIGVIQSIATS